MEWKWSQLGDDLTGTGEDDRFGRALAFSSDGSRLAVGAPWNGIETGLVQVFEWTGGTWSQIGDDLKGATAGDFFGCAVTFSSDGTRLAIGAYGSGHENGDFVGLVQIFEWRESTWSQIGDDLVGIAAVDLFGSQLALSSDGTRLAVGAPSLNDDEKGVLPGFVQVIDMNRSTCSG